jgi:uncharacterized membrane protein
MSLQLALMVYDHVEGAERAYSDARDAMSGAPWLQEIAFAEHHHHDRIVVRGSFGGHYVDEDDKPDVIGKKTAEGALTGAVAGFAFGPVALAVGLVGGATAGAIAQSNPTPALHGAFFDEVRADVPENSSAIVLLAAEEHVQAMVVALGGSGGKLVLRLLTDEAADALEQAVASYPDLA